MKLHRFIIQAESAWGTPLRSDTLYGLILYHLAELEGDNACQALINSFKQAQAPFSLSSLMPENHLFFPKLPPLSRSFFRELVNQGQFINKEGEVLDIYEALKEYKSFRKVKYLPLEIWKQHASDLSMQKLFTLYCQGELTKAFEELSKTSLKDSSDPLQKSKPYVLPYSEPHVSISRINNTAIEGGLFFNTVNAYSENIRFHLYVRTSDEYLNTLNTWLKHIGNVGFGKDSSTGKGRFSVELDTAFKGEDLELMHTDKTSHLLLSVCVAQDLSDIISNDAFYGLELKKGKAAYTANPFKNPYLMIQEGSVVKNIPKISYVLENIHVDNRLVQIAEPLTLACSLAVENGKG